MPVRSPPAVPLALQLPRVYRQTVSVDPPAMLGNWTVALPVPLGLRPWRISCLLLLADVDRLMLATLVPGVPTLRLVPKLPVVATARLPVKLALELMV